MSGEKHLYRFHWFDGSKNEGYGLDAADALNKMGFAHGALRALDYWEKMPLPAGVSFEEVEK